MVNEPEITKLKTACDKFAEVYESLVKDEIYDNSNIATLNDAILAVETVIKHLKEREE